ncbi:MAG: SURF1 family protein [Endozoicomonadaceae bacterium]|nr:SURF1 family protein [Endozoicomonadaceae bacterium]
MIAIRKNIYFGLLYCIIFTLLLNLGCWQYTRYQQKQDNETRYAAYMTRDAIDLNGVLSHKKTDFLYQPVHFSGCLDETAEYWLDNQMCNHQVGYRVFSVVYLNSTEKEAVLIDRGWHERKKNINPIKKLMLSKEHLFEGILWRPQGAAFLLKQDQWRPGWPKIIQSIDQKAIKKIANDLQCPVLPWIVILNQDQPGVLIRQLPRPPMTAQKHLGYAIQWFLMALVLTILMAFFYIKKRRGSHVS